MTVECSRYFKAFTNSCFFSLDCVSPSLPRHNVQICHFFFNFPGPLKLNAKTSNKIK